MKKMMEKKGLIALAFVILVESKIIFYFLNLISCIYYEMIFVFFSGF